MLLASASHARGDDAALARQIQQAVEAHDAARLSEMKVQIDARDGAVLLRGSVRFLRQKLLYEQVAWQTPGVREVENELRVAPLLPVPDADIERQVIELAKLNRFQGAEVRAQVRDGAVTVHGTFHDPADVFFLRRRLADIEGVRSVAIEASFAV
jgi:osmotically-inducible protein OsmY